MIKRWKQESLVGKAMLMSFGVIVLINWVVLINI